MKYKKGAPKKIGNYVVFEEIHTDSIGANLRAVEVEDDLKPTKHRLLAELHPFLLLTPEEWNRTNILCQRIQESGIPNLYAPKKIFKDDNTTFFEFPYMESKTLAQIVEDASRQKKHIPFNMAFSISIAVASLIEMGASIIPGGQNASHGFLTPDHIIFDYEGNIYLKYFGLWNLLNKNETAVSEMIRMYAAWLSPEFIRREPINPRSDIYHLGYIVYRMLTGNYFSYLPGEDFQSTFTSISFVSDLPSTDITFLTNLIDFFKKTLNPDTSKRFSSPKEFKNYVLKYLQTEEFSEFKTTLSGYMKSLYADTIELEKQELSEELSKPPVLANANAFEPDEIVMGRPPEKKQSKLKIFFIITIIIAIAAVSGYFIVDELNKTKEGQEETAQLLEKQNQKIQQFQQQLKTFESTKKDQPVVIPPTVKPIERDTTKTSDKVPPTETSDKSQIIPKEVTNTDKSKEISPAIIQPAKPAETVEKKEPPKEEVKPPAPLVGIKEITLLPQRVSGKEPQFPAAIRKAYVGRRATVKADLLIDENGNVAQVELLESSEIPGDVQVIIKDTLKQWKYKPAQKGDMKVKVKWPEKFKIAFTADI